MKVFRSKQVPHESRWHFTKSKWYVEEVDNPFYDGFDRILTTCGYCDEPMIDCSGRSRVNSMQRIYCSDECRRQARARAKRAKYAEAHGKMHDKTCEQCGEQFVAKRSDARYCGPTCRQRARRIAKAVTA